jgi:hypothetical protein
MDATPIDFGDARPLARVVRTMGIHSPSDDPVEDSAVTLAGTWSAIHAAAATVGAIAGLDRMRVADDIERGMTVGVTVAHSGVDQAVHDLAEMMGAGIAALLTAHTSGGAPQAAAGALWREFIAARDVLLPSHLYTTGARR